jgi:ribulose-phosphate 3-epimerase
MALGSELSHLESAGVGLLHFDVMDGCFCPMMTFGPAVIAGLKIPMLKDVHLMIEEPLNKVEAFSAAGADIITVHAESTRHAHQVLQAIGRLKNANDPERGMVRGLALNPGTPLEAIEPLAGELDLVLILAVNPGWGGQKFIPSALERIREVRRRFGEDILITLDGGVTRENIADLKHAGADIIVSGSAVFDGKSALDNARYMRSALR